MTLLVNNMSFEYFRAMFMGNGAIRYYSFNSVLPMWFLQLWSSSALGKQCSTDTCPAVVTTILGQSQWLQESSSPFPYPYSLLCDLKGPPILTLGSAIWLPQINTSFKITWTVGLAVCHPWEGHAKTSSLEDKTHGRDEISSQGHEELP